MSLFNDASGMTGPRLLSIDMLVLEILLGSLSIILVVQMDLKIKGSLLWAAYSLLDSHSLTTVVKVSKSHHN